MNSGEEEIKHLKEEVFVVGSELDKDADTDLIKEQIMRNDSDENISIAKRIYMNLETALDSVADSEQKNDLKSQTTISVDTDNMSSDEEEIKHSKGKRFVVRSDSEDDADTDLMKEQIMKSNSDENISIAKRIFMKLETALDSDTDSEQENDLKSQTTKSVVSVKNTPEEKTIKHTKEKRFVFDSDSEDNTANHVPKEQMATSDNEGDDNVSTVKKKPEVVVDSDSNSEQEDDLKLQTTDLVSSKNVKARKSAKAAKLEIQEIHRESQRIVRESQVSLPYHRPKQRTLAEFLQRCKSTPVVSLRTSKDRLNQVWKHLEEREKEAAEFYKSDSENSNEEPPFRVKNKKKKSNQIKTTVLNSCILDDVTQVLEKILCEIVSNCDNDVLLKTDEVSVDAPLFDKRKIHVDVNNVCDTSSQNCEYKCNSTNELKEDNSTNTNVGNVELENDSMVITDTHLNKKTDLNNQVPDSQNFELHLSESERFSEEINIDLNVYKQNDVTVSVGEAKQSCTEEPNWVQAAIDYENTRNKNENLCDKKTVPTITGMPSEVIDLDGNGNRGVVNLMERFIKHISLRPKSKHKAPTHISIMSAEKDQNGQVCEIKQDIVTVVLTEEEEDDPKLAKPGFKLAKLKAQLKAQIGQRRENEWMKKLNDKRMDEEQISDGEKSECDASDELSDSDKEVENDECAEEEEEEEDEEEENEEYYIEKKKKAKNQFVDEEAEESEDGDDNDDISEEEGEDSCSSFIKKAKTKQTKLKRMESTDMFASQDIFNKIQYDEDGDEDSFTIGQDSKDRGNQEPDIDKEPHNILNQSPAFPIPTREGRDSDNILSWGSSPTLTQKERFSIFKKEEQSEQTLSGLSDILNCQAPPPSTQELIGLCSGQFTSQPIHCSQLEDPHEAGSQDLDDVWLHNSQSPCLTSKTQTRKEEGKPSLILSDDEDVLQVKKHNKKKLDFSDDETDLQSDQNEENIESEDENVDSKSNDETVTSERNVDDVEYDSEENEIPRDAVQFLDKEAELSESDWDSEDEDENGLDRLEQEEADKEKIDHEADKEELGKMHIRRMLVEDTKEVKLLQEMLLEDGDLHSDGNGRQRLFRWSNQDGDEEIRKSLVCDSDEEKDEDEDDEENWRRSRHERETFLREFNKKRAVLETEDIVDDGSQFFKLKKTTLLKTHSNSQEKKANLPTDLLSSPDAKQSKRGSFLSRGQQVLSRLAQLTSAANPDAPVLKPINSRNFVFASISPTKDEPEVPLPSMATKRKRQALPLPVAKRPCLTSNPVSSRFSKKRSLLEQLAKSDS